MCAHTETGVLERAYPEESVVVCAVLGVKDKVELVCRSKSDSSDNACVSFDSLS